LWPFLGLRIQAPGLREAELLQGRTQTIDLLAPVRLPQNLLIGMTQHANRDGKNARVVDGTQLQPFERPSAPETVSLSFEIGPRH